MGAYHDKLFPECNNVAHFTEPDADEAQGLPSDSPPHSPSAPHSRPESPSPPPRPPDPSEESQSSPPASPPPAPTCHPPGDASDSPRCSRDDVSTTESAGVTGAERPESEGTEAESVEPVVGLGGSKTDSDELRGAEAGVNNGCGRLEDVGEEALANESDLDAEEAAEAADTIGDLWRRAAISTVLKLGGSRGQPTSHNARHGDTHNSDTPSSTDNPSSTDSVQAESDPGIIKRREGRGGSVRVAPDTQCLESRYAFEKSKLARTRTIAICHGRRKATPQLWGWQTDGRKTSTGESPANKVIVCNDPCKDKHVIALSLRMHMLNGMR